MFEFAVTFVNPATGHLDTATIWADSRPLAEAIAEDMTDGNRDPDFIGLRMVRVERLH